VSRGDLRGHEHSASRSKAFLDVRAGEKFVRARSFSSSSGPLTGHEAGETFLGGTTAHEDRDVPPATKRIDEDS
jgi:hypothetical protein